MSYFSSWGCTVGMCEVRGGNGQSAPRNVSEVMASGDTLEEILRGRQTVLPRIYARYIAVQNAPPKTIADLFTTVEIPAGMPVVYRAARHKKIDDALADANIPLDAARVAFVDYAWDTCPVQAVLLDWISDLLEEPHGTYMTIQDARERLVASGWLIERIGQIGSGVVRPYVLVAARRTSKPIDFYQGGDGALAVIPRGLIATTTVYPLKQNH